MSAWDVIATAALVLSGVLYAMGRRRVGRVRVLARAGAFEPIAFLIGWTAMIVAIVPPLNRLVLDRFSLHMVQHELIMLVGAPLMVAGRPLPCWLWGLPFQIRAATASWFRRGSRLGRVWRGLSAPVAAWAIHGATLWIWHAPALYELAVRNEGVHALQHAMFGGTAALFWWGLIHGRYGRAGYGASVFYVFTTVLHTGLLGAVFVIAPVPMYGIYATRTPDPLVDQQLAGLIMWIPAGAILTLTGIALFAAWLGESDRRARWAEARRITNPE